MDTASLGWGEGGRGGGRGGVGFHSPVTTLTRASLYHVSYHGGFAG